MKPNKVIWYLVGLFIVLITYPSSGWSKTLQTSALDHKISGDRYLREGKTSSAISKYHKALVLNPSSTATYFNLSIAYFSERKLLEAISALEELLKINEQDAEALYNLACLRLYQGKLEEATTYFKKARSCCDSSFFATIIDEGLEYVNELSALPTPAQALALFTLQLQQELTPTPVML